VTAPPVLETPRLRLRPPEPDDAGSIFADYARDPEVTRYLTWRPHATVEQTREFLRRCARVRAEGSAYPLAIVSRQDGRVLGMIELRVEGHAVNLGYVLARPYWGTGVMTEAARAVVEWALAQPGVYRVWAVCDVDNVGSARVLEKAGLQREGILRRYLMHPNTQDTPRDCFCYARVT
jgi:[ribosomal protein S5]-alanine N-acetyltransferase